jgi:hypothetical protein
MATAEDRLWTRVVGDDWRWSFTTTDNVSNWSNPLAQLRRDNVSTGELVATSTTAEGVTANLTITANFGTGDLAWHIGDTVTATFDPGSYWFELSVQVAGDVTTVLTHHLSVVDQVAVEP